MVKADRERGERRKEMVGRWLLGDMDGDCEIHHHVLYQVQLEESLNMCPRDSKITTSTVAM